MKGCFMICLGSYINIRANYCGSIYPMEAYQGYRLKEAIRHYRKKHGLKNKHLSQEIVSFSEVQFS